MSTFFVSGFAHDALLSVVLTVNYCMKRQQRQYEAGDRRLACADSSDMM